MTRLNHSLWPKAWILLTNTNTSYTAKCIPRFPLRRTISRKLWENSNICSDSGIIYINAQVSYLTRFTNKMSTNNYKKIELQGLGSDLLYTQLGAPQKWDRSDSIVILKFPLVLLLEALQATRENSPRYINRRPDGVFTHKRAIKQVYAEWWSLWNKKRERKGA